MDFQRFVQMDKAELHLHLEGSMRPERLLALASEAPGHPFHGVSLAQLKERFRTANFLSFIENFMAGYRLLEKAEDFQVVLEELLADLEAQGVSCAHILYSPGVYSQRLGVPVAQIHKGIGDALAQAPKIRVAMVVDTVINLGLPFMQETMRRVMANREPFVGGFSVGGGSPDVDMHTFLPLFHEASKAGLFCVAHAGEVDGPANIETLLRETDVVRIAHGCHAVQSADTLALMKRRGVTVDVNITSNLFTGTVAELQEHPLPIFRDHGIPVTLNTDDPLYFDTTLHREYELATQLRGVDDAALEAFAAHSIEAFNRVVQ